MGMFEQNNIGIDVPSPLELYLDNLDQTQHKSLQSMGVMRDLIAEAAECPLQVCVLQMLSIRFHDFTCSFRGKLLIRVLNVDYLAHFTPSN